MKAILTSLCVLSCISCGEENPSTVAQAEIVQLVEQMRGRSMQATGRMRSDGSIDPEEQQRQAIIDRLRAHGTKCVPSLSDALSDSDVRMRKNGALALIALAGPYEKKKQVDIREAIPALITATGDSDADVRAWAAHALAEIGPAAKPAIPVLITLLSDTQEGPRNTSCMALGSIGPAAQDALPALRKLLSDPKEDVRMFAQVAMDKIEAEQDGADQPATALESKPEGKQKRKPESEERSQ